jgi:hypothetical protein
MVVNKKVKRFVIIYRYVAAVKRSTSDLTEKEHEPHPEDIHAAYAKRKKGPLLSTWQSPSSFTHLSSMLTIYTKTFLLRSFQPTRIELSESSLLLPRPEFTRFIKLFNLM